MDRFLIYLIAGAAWVIPIGIAIAYIYIKKISDSKTLIEILVEAVVALMLIELLVGICLDTDWRRVNPKVIYFAIMSIWTIINLSVMYFRIKFKKRFLTEKESFIQLAIIMAGFVLFEMLWPECIEPLWVAHFHMGV